MSTGKPFVLELPSLLKPVDGKRMSFEMPGFKAGLQITCPQCKAAIGELRRDLYHSMTVAADSIRWEPGQHRDYGEPAVCKGCGATFMAIESSVQEGRRLRVHTALGWL